MFMYIEPRANVYKLLILDFSRTRADRVSITETSGARTVTLNARTTVSCPWTTRAPAGLDTSRSGDPTIQDGSTAVSFMKSTADLFFQNVLIDALLNS